MRKIAILITTSFIMIIGTMGCLSGFENLQSANAKGIQQVINEKHAIEKQNTNLSTGLQQQVIPHTNQTLMFLDSENSDLLSSQREVRGNGEKQAQFQKKSSVAKGKKPKNVILLIGDGMGIGQMEVARLFEHGKGGRLFMESLPHSALVHTYSANNFVTDSAAAGTALAIGAKTENESIGVTADGKEADSILDLFKKDGKKGGVISTNTVTDATPAAFTASVPNRWSGQSEVARQQLQNDIDVLLGGGRSYFEPAKQNGIDLIAKYKEKGYTYVKDKDELMKAKGDKLLGLFHPSYMNYKIDRDEAKTNEPTLTEMTEKAVEFLSKEKKGFFLMVEGARIDHASHAADFTSIWKETVEFDDAVKYSVNWAKNNGDTLILVLADHETMGISATEAMNIKALKNILATPEYMASKLEKAEGSEEFSRESVRNVFSTYANIDLTDEQIDAFNERAKDNEGKVYAAYRVGWEIGSVIAEYHHAGAVNSAARSLSSTGGHTGNMVPVFSFGAGSEAFDGVLDNTDIPKIIARLMKDDFKQ